MVNLIISIIFIWWAAIIITAFKSNSVSILTENKISFKARGYAASKESVREIIKKHSENKELVKQLTKNLFYARLSEILLISWVLTMLGIIYLSQ